MAAESIYQLADYPRSTLIPLGNRLLDLLVQGLLEMFMDQFRIHTSANLLHFLKTIAIHQRQIGALVDEKIKLGNL